MNEETYQALISVVERSREYANKMNEKKRKSQSDVWKEATLYRDIVTVENWIEEVKKEYQRG